MTVTSGSHIKRKILLVTTLLFVLGVFFVLKAGVSAGLTDARHLFSVLAASYLMAWGGYALFSAVPRDEIRAQFVLMTISLGVALILAELPAWMKLIDYRQVFAVTSFLPWEQPDHLPDRELLSLPRPNRSVKMVFSRGNIGEAVCLPPRTAEPFEVRYDRNGFRNEGDLSRAEIAVIGDSYVESPMMPGSALATTRLAELQGKSVINLGQSGYGPQQELTVLKRYALPLHPKTIVWVFYEGNDLVDAQRYEERVSFLVSAWNSINTAWDRSFTRNLFLAAIQFSHGCLPNPRIAGNYGTVPADDGRDLRIYFLDHTTSVIPSGQELDALKRTGEAIKAAYELAHEARIEFVVAFAPTKFRVYYDIAKIDPNSSGDIKWWVPNDIPDRLRRIIADVSPDIHYVDLTPALRRAAKMNRLMFIPDDTHWTSDGHQVVADALDEALRPGGALLLAGKDPRVSRPDDVKLDTSSDAMMVRNKDGTIRYWSDGARKMYGWEKHKALGEISHRLLKTVFPVPLEIIEAELLARGHWEGQLIHQRRDGSKVSVVSHWELQQDVDAKDQSVTVVEINRSRAS
ncbi:MAG: PAS domain-containing protein [Nitrospira sp. CR1.3]|nr:PAS domain-containing protein [Nitrospira sp. CR1.3]